MQNRCRDQKKKMFDEVMAVCRYLKIQPVDHIDIILFSALSFKQTIFIEK